MNSQKFEDTSDECWGYSIEEYPEMWTGMLPSREEAIAEALVELNDVPVFYIHSGHRPRPQRYFPDADDVLEIAMQSADDDAGDVAEDFPDVTDEAKAELDKLLSDWVEKRVTCSFWVSDGAPERIERAVYEAKHE